MRIIAIVIASLLLAVLLFIGSLFTHPVQQFITNQAASALQKQTNYTLCIGDIRYQPLRHFTITDATLRHPGNDSVIHIPQADIQIRWTPLLHHRLHITGITIANPSLHIHIYADGTTNIDILRNIRPNPDMQLSIQIDNVTLSHCTLTIDNDLPRKTDPKGTFDPHHINITDLNTTLTLDNYSKNNLSATINDLTLTETSGLAITSLSTQLNLTDTTLTMPSLRIATASSQFNLDTLRLTYNNISQLLKLQTNATIQALITPSTITLADIAPLYDPLKHLRKPLEIQGNISGDLDTLRCTGIKIAYATTNIFSGDITAKNLLTPDSINYIFNINTLQTNTIGIQDIIASFKNNPYQLPAQIHKLGTIRYTGVINGNPRKAKIDGQLTTDIGAIRTNCQIDPSDNFQDFTINGNITSNRLQLNRLLPDSQLKNAAFNINTNINIGKNTPLIGSINAKIHEITYREYPYKNLNLKGNFTSHNVSAEINFNDENLNIAADGNLNWGKNEPQYTLSATIGNFNPHNLNLITTYPDLNIALNIDVAIAGTTVDELKGQITLSEFSLQNAENLYTLDTLTISSDTIDKNKYLTIKSQLLQGNITGAYSFTTLKKDFHSVVHHYLPALISGTPSYTTTDNFTCSLTLYNIDSLLHVFAPQWHLADTITCQGFYNPDSLLFNLKLPYFFKQGAKASFHNLSVGINNRDEKLHLLTAIDVHAPKFSTTVSALFTADNDSLLTSVNWISDTTKLFEGELLSLTRFYKQDKLLAHTSIHPTQFFLKDSLWDIAPSQIHSDFNTLQVDNFSLFRQGQYITADGVASTEMTDTIYLKLKNIDLKYISTFIPGKPIIFEGDATGEGFVTNTFTKPIFVANAHVPAFFMNDTYIGEADASTGWDIDKNAIIIMGEVDNEEKQIAKIDGYYFLRNDSIDLFGHADGLDIQFLNYWLEPITLHARGEASGDTHIYGRKKEVTVTAKAFANTAEMGVEYLKTSYTFSDSVILTPDSILFKDIKVVDKQGNNGTVSGYVTHKYFKDFRYNIDIHVDNMHVMNTTERDNSYFYGQVYATGDINISGSDDAGTYISAIAETEPHTKVIIPITNTLTAKDNSFIKFISYDKDSVQVENASSNTEENLDMLISLKIDVQPSAEAILYIDPSTGDVLKAHGNGEIIVNYDVKTDEMELFGDYTLTSGSYAFTLQNALRKDFKIHNGSSIHWIDGNPYNADVDINASYQLTASLTDILDKSVLAYTNRTTVPVQCLLHLTGNLMHPRIQFGLNLPNSDEELNRALQAVVNTDEIMNREIVYLLAMGKFYKPEYMQMTAQEELLALASSTLSSQLNNWASQLFDKWNFGVNFKTSGEGSDRSNEYEFSFLYAPNDRFTINGNVGYLDDKLSASKFIGDVDAEYKIIPSGKLSVKAYNHTNDYKEFKSALTTQGVGIVWRESFSSGKALREEWKVSAARQKAEREKRKAERKAKREKKKEEKAAKSKKS